MARVTVEDCLEQVPNRFALTILAAERARALSKGSPRLLSCDNKVAVTSLREIADAKVRFIEDVETVMRDHIDEIKRRGINVPRK